MRHSFLFLEEICCGDKIKQSPNFSPQHNSINIITTFYSILRIKPLLFLIIHLLRSITFDTQQIHHIYLIFD